MWGFGQKEALQRQCDQIERHVNSEMCQVAVATELHVHSRHDQLYRGEEEAEGDDLGLDTAHSEL